MNRASGTSLVFLSLSLALGACTSGNRVTPTGSSRGVVAATPDPADPTEMLVGIELIEVRVEDTPGMNRMLGTCEAPGIDPMTTARYRDNRIMLFRMTETELDRLLERASLVGGLGSIWCGQILEWRPFVETRIGRSLVEVLGETLLMDDGSLSLMGRGWVEPTLAGARTRLEFVPRYESDLRSPVSVLRPSRRRDLLFRELSAELSIAPGEVILITGPLRDPGDGGTTGTEAAPTSGSADDDAPRPIVELVEESESAPVEVVPTTGAAPVPERFGLGDALFAGPRRIPDGAPERVLLVIVPRIPAGMLLDETHADSTGSGS